MTMSDSSKPSTYGDTLAEIYDDLYGDAPDQAIEVLAQLIGNGGRALELGIGTGRFTLPLVARGIQVHGIDASQLILDKLHAKPGGRDIPVTVGDFAHLGPIAGAPFDFAFCTFSSLFLLPNQEDQVSCFQGTAELLRPGGKFLTETFFPDLTRYGKDQPTYVSGLERNEVLLEASQHNAVTQRISCRFIRLRGGEVRIIPVELRYAWPSELDLMARMAGLRLVQRWSNWEQHAFVPGSFKYISVFEKSDTAT